MNRRILLLAASISCCVAFIAPASADLFEPTPGPILTQIAAGRAEVWGLNASHEVYRFNGTNSQFVQVAGQLNQVAVGGGSLLQTDAVWGINASSEVFQYNFTTKAFVQVPGELTQIVVGAGDNDNCHAYEVWGINANQQVFRYNYCTLAWVNIPGFLTRISTGGSDVWGINVNSQIFQYTFASGKWVQIAGTLQQIAVGVNDVWGLDKSGFAYHYQPSSGFVQLPGSQKFTQITAGGDGAWGINPTIAFGLTVRFDPNVQNAIAIPGDFSQISSGSGAGVWAVGANGQIFSFIR